VRYYQVCNRNLHKGWLVIFFFLTWLFTYKCNYFLDQPFQGDITDEGRADMIKYTCVKPFERFQSIDKAIQRFFRYGQDENLKSINMGVDTEMMVVEGMDLFRVYNKKYLKDI